MTTEKMWRHGDVLIAKVASIPSAAKKKSGVILARGEITGHSHRIQDPRTAELWAHRGVVYLKVLSSAAQLIHEEHNTITLPQGVYRVWIQREYTPSAIRRVYD